MSLRIRVLQDVRRVLSVVWLFVIYVYDMIYLSVQFLNSCCHYCIYTVHVIRSLNCQYQHMHNFNVTG